MRKICSLLATVLILSPIIVLAVSPKQALRMGKTMQQKQNFEGALKIYKESLKEKPSVEIYTEAVSLLGKLQKYESAEAVLNKALQDFPNNTSLLNLLALIQFRKGDKPAAKNTWEKVLVLDKGNAFAKQWIGKTNEPGSEKPEVITAQNSNEPGDEDQSASYVDDYSGSMTGAYKVSHELSVDDQKVLAKNLYTQMMSLEKWEIEDFIRLHRKVIEKCPDTDQAEESCWRLSNLYLLAVDPADLQGVIDVLEHLLKTYPQTPLRPDAKNRLLVTCQRAGQFDKVVTLYEELFTLDPEPQDDKMFMVRCLEFGNALLAVGRRDDAVNWFRKIIEIDGEKNSLEARVAKRKLAEM
jgi:tetratricopeptide (TPR) repeat protein